MSVPVRDQDAALRFYTEKLGFKVATDQPMGDGKRWIELLIPGAGAEGIVGNHGDLQRRGWESVRFVKQVKRKGRAFVQNARPF